MVPDGATAGQQQTRDRRRCARVPRVPRVRATTLELGILQGVALRAMLMSMRRWDGRLGGVAGVAAR